MEDDTIQQLKTEISALLQAGQAGDALPLIRQAANWSDLEMQILARDIYTRGLYGIQPDPVQAFEYTRLAALNGDIPSQFDLGMRFKEGNGTQKDPEKAFYFLSKAAGQQYAPAYAVLAGMALMGQGTDRNLQQARSWLEQAGQAGSDPELVGKYRKMLEKLEARQKQQ